MPDIIGPTSHFYYSQRLKLHYVDWGNHGQPLAILVHGGRDHARNWDFVALALRDRFHVVAPDLRGHGDSDWAIGGAYSITDHVLDLGQLMNALEPTQNLFIGGHAADKLTSIELDHFVAGTPTGIFHFKADRDISVEMRPQHLLGSELLPRL